MPTTDEQPNLPALFHVKTEQRPGAEQHTVSRKTLHIADRSPYQDSLALRNVGALHAAVSFDGEAELRQRYGDGAVATAKDVVFGAGLLHGHEPELRAFERLPLERACEAVGDKALPPVVVPEVTPDDDLPENLDPRNPFARFASDHAADHAGKGGGGIAARRSEITQLDNGEGGHDTDDEPCGEVGEQHELTLTIDPAKAASNTANVQAIAGLSSALSSLHGTQRTYRRFSRKLAHHSERTGVLFPERLQPEATLAVVLDTSGSMGVDLIEESVCHISRYAAERGVRVVLVGCTDTASEPLVVPTSGTMVVPVVGSSTDLTQAIPTVNTLRPNATIIISDFIGTTWPQQPPTSSPTVGVWVHPANEPNTPTTPAWLPIHKAPVQHH